MRSVRLPDTNSERLHIECVFDHGGMYCIETKRCRMLQVPNDVVNVKVTGIEEGPVELLPEQFEILDTAHCTVVR